MTTIHPPRAGQPATPTTLERYFPALRWLRGYGREQLLGDGMAGVVVAIMLVPQSMAYAMLAGLPPQVGLYASIAPLLVYALLGSSPVLAVGPVAIDSLLVASGLSLLATGDPAQYWALALTLAVIIGLMQVGMGLLRMGFLANFLGQPILSGFMSAAALVILLSQVRHLLGLSLPATERFGESLLLTVSHVQETRPVVALLGLGSVALLLAFKHGLGPLLRRAGVPVRVAVPLTRAGPLVVVALGSGLVAALRLHEAGVPIVGTVPAGLPPLTLPRLDGETWRQLLPLAAVISLVGYVEGFSTAKALASKRRQKIDANRELLALGAANVAAGLTGGYPVTGGLSRSAVNMAAGAQTPLASVITAGLLALTVGYLTPTFYFLPRAVLAAIIVVAASSLVDGATLVRVWRYNRADAVALLVTFGGGLLWDVQSGILAGFVTSVALFLWRSSRPHVAVVGRLGESGVYRNVLRYEVETCPHVLAVRVDESLYFANTHFLETYLMQRVIEQPQVAHLVLIGTGINTIDASALQTLEALMLELRDAGVTLHLAAFKGPVLDRLKAIGFVALIGPERVHLSTNDAMAALRCP